MQDMRGMPSTWLLKNSKGFPDFLFTILTYSLILLAFVSLIWIAFGILSFVHAGSAKAQTLIEIMDNMKTGLVSLAGVVFGLAGSYTVRRFKKDEQYIEKTKMENELVLSAVQPEPNASGLQPVINEEDI